MNNLDGVKKGDYVLVKCRVDGVYSHFGMLNVTTRDCNEGFDAYLDEIEDVCDPPENKKWPKEGDRFFYIRTDGQIGDVRYGDAWIEWIDLMVAVGNVFRTYAEAEFAVERRKVRLELYKRAIQGPIKWDDNTSYWHIVYNITTHELFPGLAKGYVTDDIFFKSSADVQCAIDAVGEDRILKYMMGVVR